MYKFNPEGYFNKSDIANRSRIGGDLSLGLFQNGNDIFRPGISFPTRNDNFRPEIAIQTGNDIFRPEMKFSYQK